MTELGAAEVHVWHGDVDGADDDNGDGGDRDSGDAGQGGGLAAEPLDRDLAILSASELARCQRFVRPADRVRFAAMHAAARRVLAGYLGAGPAEIRFGRIPCCHCGHAEHGPPRIDWPPTDITFNQSGSAGRWLLAVSRGRPVGADIEVPRQVDVGDLAAACLTAAEKQYLQTQPEAGRQRLFFRCWTRKEAVLKACGIGLAGSLGNLETQPDSDGPVTVSHRCAAGPDLWLVQDLPAGPGTAIRPGADGWLGAIAQPAAGAGRVSVHSQYQAASPGISS